MGAFADEHGERTSSSLFAVAIAGGHTREVHAFIHIDPDELPSK
jgi:hypothetical protein